MKIKRIIALLSVITTVSINCSLTEKINASKDEISELRKKSLNGEKVNPSVKCSKCQLAAGIILN